MRIGSTLAAAAPLPGARPPRRPNMPAPWGASVHRVAVTQRNIRDSLTTRIGYHASHEQFAPGELLARVVQAQAAGFGAGFCSDHFNPWSERQGHSGYAWSWLGAAMQATTLPFGVVCAPGQRYHPAIVAQAAATLEQMFPGRLWLAIGSGEFVNEAITGDPWPLKADRNARLRECADIMRALWAGETVTHHGHVHVEDARLYTLPERPPLLVGAAVTAKTARWVGEWADALITVTRPDQGHREVADAFRDGGGAGKPMLLKAQVAYAEDEDAALHGAWDQWRTNIFDSSVLADLRTVAQFDALGELVRPEDLRGPVRISSDPGRHAAWLAADLELGFDVVSVHNVIKEQQRFIDVFGERVLPQLGNVAR